MPPRGRTDQGRALCGMAYQTEGMAGRISGQAARPAVRRLTVACLRRPASPRAVRGATIERACFRSEMAAFLPRQDPTCAGTSNYPLAVKKSTPSPATFPPIRATVGQTTIGAADRRACEPGAPFRRIRARSVPPARDCSSRGGLPRTRADSAAGEVHQRDARAVPCGVTPRAPLMRAPRARLGRDGTAKARTTPRRRGARG